VSGQRSRVLEVFTMVGHLQCMPDGSHAAPLSMPEACAPSLNDALEWLLACAEQGLRPEGVLQDIRVLLSDRGLLLSAGTLAQAAEPTQHLTDPAPPSHTGDGAVRS
jgi:hypothetical protein